MVTRAIKVTLRRVVSPGVATIALGLLAVGGVAKVFDPDPTEGALRAARLPSARWVVRVLGVAEISAALLGLVGPARATAPAALLYLGFALFTLGAVRNRIPLQSCGCFGREDTPPSWLHVGYNGVAALSLGWIVLYSASPVPWGLPPLQIAAYLAFSGLGVFASYLLLTRLPQLMQVAQST